jgi:hypothetical protein
MSEASGSSQPETESRPESINESGENQSIAIEIDDDKEEEVEDDVEVGSKRKLTSVVWKEFKRVK